MATEAQRRATERYRRKSTKQVIVRFYPGDMELYEHLRSQPNMAGYVKRLIREDMERGRAEAAAAGAEAGEPADPDAPAAPAPGAADK